MKTFNIFGYIITIKKNRTRKEYMKEYQRKNKEHLKEYHRMRYRLDINGTRTKKLKYEEERKKLV
jgi:hypothetical protein